jgi:hypothetical protein
MNDYRKLAQPGLGDSLRNYIVDNQRNVIARRAAVNIARARCVHELQPELPNAALNVAEEPSIRAGAVSALGKCGDDNAKVQLL